MRVLENAAALAVAIVITAVVAYLLYICLWIIIYAGLFGIGIAVIYLIYQWIHRRIK